MGGGFHGDFADDRPLMQTKTDIMDDYDTNVRIVDAEMKRLEKKLRADVIIELRLYTELKLMGKWGDNPLTWWRLVGAAQFPWCAKLARRDFAVFGSQAAIVRIFIHCGRLVSKQRAAMKPATVERMAFLYFNNHMINYV